MFNDNLLISCTNGGGLIQIAKDGKLKIIDHYSTTGFWISPDHIYRAVHFRKHSVIIAYHKKTAFLFDDISDFHDILFFKDHLYVVSTGTNEVVELSDEGKIVARWRFKGEKDAWHLNCLDVWDGRVIVSAFGEFYEHRGYKKNSLRQGFVMDLETGERLIANLSQPHSPEHDAFRKYIGSSETKSLLVADDTGLHEKFFESYVRGIAVSDQVIYIGLSESRNITCDETGSKILMLDKTTMEIISEIKLPFPEIYQIKVIPDLIRLNPQDLALNCAAKKDLTIKFLGQTPRWNSKLQEKIFKLVFFVGIRKIYGKRKMFKSMIRKFWKH